jgi:hypothetical protein
VTGISGHCLASDMDFDPLHGADEVLMESGIVLVPGH